MNNAQFFTRSAVVCGFALMSFAPALNKWQVKNEAKANFQIDGMMGIDVNGTLAFKNSMIAFDPDNPATSQMRATLTVSSMATGIAKRDKHLKSDDYFAAGKYPDIIFQSSRIEQAGKGQFKVTGNLTIKAVTKGVAIPFTFTQTGNDGLFKGDFKINRVDYGIGNGKETGMGIEVRIKLNIPVKKA